MYNTCNMKLLRHDPLNSFAEFVRGAALTSCKVTLIISLTLRPAESGSIATLIGRTIFTILTLAGAIVLGFTSTIALVF